MPDHSQQRPSWGPADARARLEEALARAEFDLRYQPVVSLRDGRVAGFEALLRWRTEHHGLIGPDDFLPAAESGGLMAAIGSWVRAAAIQRLGEWRAHGRGDLWLSVNIAIEELIRPDLASELGRLAAAEGVDPGRLKLEISEARALTDAARLPVRLAALREVGVSLAIDDFGAGATALAWLDALPVDTLKLDAQFVDGVGARPRAQAVVRHVCALAHELGMTVVAEGVETRHAATLMARLGCDYGQGHWMAQAIPADAVLAFARAD